MTWKPDQNRWAPWPHQERWMRSPAFEQLVGGAAGPGKSGYLLAEALRHVHRPGYHALILRREAKQLKTELLPAAHDLYPRVGGRWRGSDASFWFPSGARIEFGGVEAERDVHKYQGASLQYLAWDELTHFSLSQYLYMFARLRPSGLSPDIEPRIRAASNPGGVGHDWVLDRFGHWLYPRPGQPHHDPSFKGPFAAPGEILWFLRDASGDERLVAPWMPGAKTRTFQPARVQDNPIYKGTSYEANLAALQLLDRERLLGGNWMARPCAGMFFKRAWFDDCFVDVAPARVLARVRYWDLAATPAARAKGRGAWTAGFLISKTSDGLFWLEHVERGQWSPGEVEKTVRVTAETDPKGTIVAPELDPGQAGVAQAAAYVKLLAGFNVRPIRVSADKITRCKPVSAQAEAGNLRIVRGESADWIGPFLREAESFPDGTMDQIDSLSGGFNLIAKVSGYKGSAAGSREMTSTAF